MLYYSSVLGFFTKKQGFTSHLSQEVRVGFPLSLFRKKGTGFTLIELLVVLAIVGLLISVIVVSFGPPRKGAKDAKRQTDIKQISLAMDLCHDDSDCGAGVNQYILTTGGANVITTISTYLPSVPTDPVDSSPYQYTWIDNSADTTKYCVYTKLEAPVTDTWIAASHKGTRMGLTINPSIVGVDCW